MGSRQIGNKWISDQANQDQNKTFPPGPSSWDEQGLRDIALWKIELFQKKASLVIIWWLTIFFPNNSIFQRAISLKLCSSHELGPGGEVWEIWLSEKLNYFKKKQVWW